MVRDRQGGSLLEGVRVNSGCLNAQLLEGKPDGRVYALTSLRDWIDAIITHEYKEDRLGTQEATLKQGANTTLLVTDGTRRILKAME